MDEVGLDAAENVGGGAGEVDAGGSVGEYERGGR